MSAVKIKNRHRLKNKEIKKIQNELKKMFNYEFFDERSSVETGDIEGMRIIFVDGEPVFTIYENRIVFTLQGLYKYKPREKSVVVDMGAVKFVTSGADIMAPGIVDADKDINENDQVWICDEKYHKPLAVGIAIMTGKQMISERQGKAIKVIHYVGDRLWNLIAKSL
jgi:PUA domain protein